MIVALLSIKVVYLLLIQLEKAYELNLHFKSVYTAIESLSNSRTCKMKLHDVADCGKLPSEALTPGMQQYVPVMDEFSISPAY